MPCRLQQHLTLRRRIRYAKECYLQKSLPFLAKINYFIALHIIQIKGCQIKDINVDHKVTQQCDELKD